MSDMINRLLNYTSMELVESLNKAVDIVAREKSFLATVEGFPLEGTRGFVKYIIDQNYAQYLIIVDNEVKGWCDIIPKGIPEFAHVGVLGMGILKEYRGKGLGRELLERAIEHARRINRIEKVELTVFESNTNAIRLYRKMGFFEEGKRLKSRKLDCNYDNELLMGKYIQ